MKRKLTLLITTLFMLSACSESLETTFSVDGEILRMDGVITSQTPNQIKTLFAENPAITTIVMGEVLGSVDDEANLEISEWLIGQEIDMAMNSDSLVASGGVDFFLAGKNRLIARGAQVGVHSWATGPGRNAKTAVDFPRGHEYHLPYIEYYKKTGFSQKQAEDFYYFTIYAAPAQEVHVMTDQELLDYNITTEPLK